MSKTSIYAEFSFYSKTERPSREVDRAYKFASRADLEEFIKAQRSEQYPLYILSSQAVTEYFDDYALPRS